MSTLLFLYKQPVYKQLGLDLQKVKQLLELKHVTISNFANKIFAYENIATTLGAETFASGKIREIFAFRELKLSRIEQNRIFRVLIFR